MALITAKCTQCGAAIEVEDTKDAGICNFCGTAFVTQKVINKDHNKNDKGQRIFPWFMAVVLPLLLAAPGIALIIASFFTHTFLIYIGGGLFLGAIIEVSAYVSMWNAQKQAQNMTNSFQIASMNLDTMFQESSDDFNTAFQKPMGDFSTIFDDILGNTRAQTNGNSSIINYQNYSVIQNNMTLQQVETIIGKGKESYSGTQNGKFIKTLIWQNSGDNDVLSAIRTITVKFENDKVIEKSQVGL